MVGRLTGLPCVVRILGLCAWTFAAQANTFTIALPLKMTLLEPRKEEYGAHLRRGAWRVQGGFSTLTSEKQGSGILKHVLL